MGIEGSDFREFSRTQGKLRMAIMGQSEEIDHKSGNFINADGTIGCSEVNVDDKINYMFLSKTDKGLVMTMVGENDGPLPVPVEGYHRIMCTNADSTFEHSFEWHRKALEETKPVADKAWLEKTVPQIPQKALDATMKMFGAMEGMMNQVGEAMGQMMEGLGQAMAGAMEGVGEALGGAVEGMAKAVTGGDAGKKDKKKAKKPAKKPAKAKKGKKKGKK